MSTHYQTIIIGGGLSGLTVAHKLRVQAPEHRFLLLEKSGSTGGVIRTHRENGFITEIGPHGFLDNCQESKDILTETGLDRECVKAPLIDFVRYVYLRGELQCIPQTPRKIAFAPLISWKEKIRVLAEWLQPPLAGEPTVAKWVNHRFGPALLPFADAVFTGTYAGDFDRLAIDAVMPGVRALEKEHGSMLRGLAARMLAKRKAGAKKKQLAMPAMTSFPNGMARLPERLTELLTPDVNLRLNCSATSINRHSGRWQVMTDSGPLSADHLVIATPINISLQLLSTIAPELDAVRIPEAWITTVVFGFGPGVTLPPGFGFLTPESENRFTLGSLFSSNMFPNRAPKDHVVFETLVGGRRHPERLDLDRDELIANALVDVQDILSIREKPLYTTVLRSNGGIPQLEQGYTGLLARRDELIHENRGLHVCGFGWEGIGLNDMIKTATRVSAAILNDAASTRQETEVKKVYF